MSGGLMFNLVLLATAVYFVWSTTGYEWQAQQIPFLIGGMVLLLQAWVTVRDVIVKKALPAAPAAAGLEAALTEPPPGGEARRVAIMCGWMLLYFALFTVAGTLPATFLFILLFLLASRDVGWWKSLAVSVGMSAAIWILFVRLMHFELYPGLLFGGTIPPI